MELNYEKTEEKFKDYIDECRNLIKDKLFTEEEVSKSFPIKNSLVSKGIITNNSSIEDAIKIHRNDLIDIKLNHTMRVVSDITKMAEKMNLNIDFTKVVKVSALLHDIARFPQAVYSNDFNDCNCSLFNGSYHAEYGYQMLYVNKNFDKFLVSDKYKFIISQPVRYHQIPVLEGDLALLFTKPDQLDINKYVTGREDLSEPEKVIVAALVQMVKDVDMLDILYQHLTGEFPVVRDSITFDLYGETLEQVANHFEISAKEIKDYNGLESDDISSLKSIAIPVNNVMPSKLIVPQDIQDRFFNNELLDLKELQNRQDWTFITGMWWRLNHFLNCINFVSNLEVIKENELLDNIYNTYPDKYKPLVLPAFEYAKEVLLDKAIKNNEGQIYKTR